MHLSAFALSSLFLLLSSQSLVTAQKSCSSDPCLRAVKSNSRNGGFVGCSAFFRETVTPKTITVTTTISSVRTKLSRTTDIESSVTTTQTTTATTTTVPFTTTSTSTVVTLRKRSAKAVTNSQTSLPSYASAACTNTVRYSSACSCIGATHATITVQAPTKVKTTTLHAVTTVTTTITTATTSVETSVSTDVVTSTSITTASTTATTNYCQQISATTPILPNPTLLAAHNYTGGFDEMDDVYISLSLPFPVSIYGDSASDILVNTNGFVSHDPYPGEPVDTEGGQSYNNGALPNYNSNLRANSRLPDTALAIFWTDLVCTTQPYQGIYYYIDGDVGSRVARIEWIMSTVNQGNAYEHFIMSLPESSSDNVRYTYFGTTPEGATVGAQSQSAGMYTQFTFEESTPLTPGLDLVYDPASNTFVVSSHSCSAT